MRLGLGAALLVLACTASAAEESKVLELTDEDLDATISQHEFLLVEFYAPWCEHCKALEPELERAAATLAARDPPIPLAKVNAADNEASAMFFQVETFPTLKWFTNGLPLEYEGGHTADDMVAWAERMSAPPCTPLPTRKAIAAFKKSARAVVVAAAEAGSDHQKQIENAARLLEVPVGLVTDGSLVATGLPSVVLFSADHGGSGGEGLEMPTGAEGEEGEDGEGGFDFHRILSFVNVHTLPLVAVFNEQNAQQIFGAAIDNHFLYVNDDDNDGHEELMEMLASVAKDFRGKTLFVHVPAEEEQVLGFFGIGEADLPVGVLVALEQQMATFRLDKPLTADNVRAHVEAFHAGTLEQRPDSERGAVKEEL